MAKPVKDLDDQERDELVAAVFVWQLCLWRKFPWDYTIIRTADLRVDVDRLFGHMITLLRTWKPGFLSQRFRIPGALPASSDYILYPVSVFARSEQRKVKTQQILFCARRLKRLSKKPLPSPFLQPKRRKQ